MTQAKDQDKDYDLPWSTVIAKAEQLINANPHILLYQKFTCQKCLSRQIIDEPNKFYTQGQCQECNHISELRVQGCGYLAHFPGAY